jgi:hypothetical protein
MSDQTILRCIELTGKTTQISMVLIRTHLQLLDHFIGKTWQNPYFVLIGIFVASIQFLDIVEQFMEHTYQVSMQQNA